MRVEQTIYGEVRGGHALRATSCDIAFARDLASRLDLPDTAPPGISWSPYVSGFAFQGRYVIARTFLDESAPRAGMVFTHALIAPLNEACDWENITGLFSHLLKSPQAPDELLGFELLPLSEKKPHAPELVGAANALVRDGNGPVVRVGVDGFEQLVGALWANLWPAARRTFGFRLSFGPADLGLESDAPALVCTPSQLRAPWTRFRVLAPDDSVPNSAAAELLAGKRDSVALHQFALDFGIDLLRIADLPIAERAMNLVSTAQSFEELLAVTRVIGILAPSATRGVERKAALLQRLAAAVGDATVAQLFLTRNLSDSAFAGPQAFWNSVESRLAARSFSVGDDSTEIQMLTAIFDSSLANASWQTMAKTAFLKAAGRGSSGFATAVWRWTQHDTSNFNKVLELLPSNRSMGSSLAKAAPAKLNFAAPAVVLRALVSRGWLDAHGALLSATLTPAEAVRQQLKADHDDAYVDGLRCALRAAKPSQVVECALAFNDERLISLAVETAVQSPEVFFRLDFAALAAQQIWGKAIAKKATLWKAPQCPVSARDAILSELLKGKPFNEELLLALGQSPLADLSDSPTRPQVWEVLPRTARASFLNATGQAWLDNAIATASWTTLEAPLQEWLLASTELESCLSASATPLATAFAIIGALQEFDERRFLTCIPQMLSSHRRLSSTEADSLGQLMLARNWTHSVNELADRYLAQRPDIRPALIKCAAMLSWVKRWIYGIRTLSPDEKWRAFIDEVAKLYPSGPDHAELWSRVGGKNADLPTGYSGRARWHTLGEQLRLGRRPGARQLLAEMQLEFPHNQALRLFSNDTDIVGRLR